MTHPRFLMMATLTAASPLALMASPVAPKAPPARLAPCEQRSEEILQALTQGRFDHATTHFDARMAAALDAGKLGQLWQETLPAQVGAYQFADAPQSRHVEGSALVERRLHFARADLTLRVACDSAGQVGGLFFAPASSATGAGTHPTSDATDHDRDEEAISVYSPFGPLPGILTMPNGHGPFAAVLLLAGSGPEDHDETIGPNKPLRDIAHALATAGIASMRYDKRTLVYPDRLADKPITIDDEVTNDALRALRQMRADPRIDARRLFVAGHSLGALMAPRIAQRDGKLAGIIMLAPPVRLSLDVVLRQFRYLESLKGGTYAPLADEIPGLLAARDTLAKADPAHPPEGSFFHAPASYWLSLRDYHAIATAKALDAPILILQGERDFQVTMADDFKAWRKAFAGQPRVTLHAYPGLGHLFMPAGDPPSPADYDQAQHVDAGVTRDMAAWIRQQPAITP